MILVVDTNVWISALQFAKGRDLLTLGVYKGTRILTPSEYLRTR